MLIKLLFNISTTATKTTIDKEFCKNVCVSDIESYSPEGKTPEEEMKQKIEKTIGAPPPNCKNLFHN